MSAKSITTGSLAALIAAAALSCATAQAAPLFAYNSPAAPQYAPVEDNDQAADAKLDPRLQRQVVNYATAEAPGSVIVDTPHTVLYFVLGNGKALRYGIAVGIEGAAWTGTSTISNKREWPDWTPTPGELKRFPDLPKHMDGGPDNPLGARALYLGNTLFRIHGTNEPWKIGAAVSSGCIRMSNNDAIDLYDRTKVGATVVVR